MNFHNMRRAITAIVLVVGLFWTLRVTVGQYESNRVKPPSIEKSPSFVPKDGFVPNEATAVKIAEAILVPIYGERLIASERPFKATLKDSVWTVIGTLPPQFLGGTAIVKLSKQDGRVLYLIHEQ